MPRFSEVLKAISTAPTRRALWAVTLDHLHEQGVKRVSYHAVDAEMTTLRIAADGFPEEWMASYIGGGLAEIDPIPELAARLAEPFYWHDIERLDAMSPDTTRYLEAMRRARLGDGVAFYVFGPGLQNAYVGLGFGVERLDLAPDDLFGFQCIAQAGHLRYCALCRRPGASDLSRRERQILHWIAQGKSNSVIATVLAISPHTVDAHLRSIYRKLDVADRTSAAIRGIGSGLVQYPHPATTG